MQTKDYSKRRKELYREKTKDPEFLKKKREKYHIRKLDPEFKEKKLNARRRFYETHRADLTARSSQWNKANPEKRQLSGRQYYEKHYPEIRRKRIAYKKQLNDRYRRKKYAVKRDAYFYIDEYRSGRISLDEFSRKISESYVRALKRAKLKQCK